MLLEAYNMKGAAALPIVPPAEIRPTANDLTTVGKSSDI